MKKELVQDRLARAKAQKSLLGERLKLVKSHRADCERKMSSARVKAGLPAGRYAGEGYFKGDRGEWVQIHPAEQNLDDAFRFAKVGRGLGGVVERRPSEANVQVKQELKPDESNE